MAGKIARRFCHVCRDMVRAEWSGCNHVLHLLLSLVTFGLWLPVWFGSSLSNGFYCGQCGARARAHRPPRGWQAPAAAGDATGRLSGPRRGPQYAPRRE